MNPIKPYHPELVQTHENQVTTTSKIVADTFGKMHKNVLAKIDEIISETPSDFNEQNFRPIQIETDLGQNRSRMDRAYEITKDGFMILVMGFTGNKAMCLKIDFINAFNSTLEHLYLTSSKQREALISACNKLAVGNTLRSDVYTMVAHNFGYEKITQIPNSLLPEAVAFVYETILSRQKPAIIYESNAEETPLSSFTHNQYITNVKREIMDYVHLLRKMVVASGNTLPKYPEFDKEEICQAFIVSMIRHNRMMLSFNFEGKPTIGFIPEEHAVVSSESISSVVQFADKKQLPSIINEAVKRLGS